MSDPNSAQLHAIMAKVEEMWGHLNTLFDDLNASNGWEQKHGADWTFADVPYHLAYCNQDIVIRGMKLGADLPEDQQELLASPESISAWNARKFTERSANQTARQSVAQWRASCEEIRRMVSAMSDADLDSPFWMPLFFGWATTRAGLEFTCRHDWSEFMQLRIHMGREEPVPSPAMTRFYLHSMLGMMFPVILNREAAAGKNFTAVMTFTDPGVGAFRIEVADGAAAFKAGAVPQADLVMTQSVTTFVKTAQKILDPLAAIQSGEVQVNDFEALGTFGQLFPMP